MSHSMLIGMGKEKLVMPLIFKEKLFLRNAAGF